MAPAIMIQSAEVLTQSPVADTPVVYEQPLTERLRTFLRMEYLYQQLLFHMEQPSEWASRAAISHLLDIVAILTRGDSRSDVLKELERQLYVFDRYQQLPNVDEKRLKGVMRNLQNLRKNLIAVGPQYLLDTRESEFLNAIKHRSAIPGGTCEFDLPDYGHWLRKPYAERLEDIAHWAAPLKPLCDSVAELLWLLRESGATRNQTAVNGVFQHSIGRENVVSMIRVCLPFGTTLYPEISASPHRFTIRFMQWGDVQKRAVQINRDVNFELHLC
jgi:cell division protein ZapD